MNSKIATFIELAKVFSNHKFHLYLVGGTVRDILLKKELSDMDVVTDATPADMKTFINGDYTFAKMGSVKYCFNSVKFDITTLRKESSYQDFRHPNKIVFVKSLKTDHKRRDFTINAMYMDEKLKLYDFENGLEDLEKRQIRMVGNPYKRLKEDPIRIIRCLRFSLTYDFSIEEELKKALMQSAKYLIMTSKTKIQMEIKKVNPSLKEKLYELMNNYSINKYIDVIE